MSYCPSLAVAAKLVLRVGGIVVTYVYIPLFAYKRSRRGDFHSLFARRLMPTKRLVNLNPHTSEDCIPLLIDMEDS